jgi:hypothetical protein
MSLMSPAMHRRWSGTVFGGDIKPILLSLCCH